MRPRSPSVASGKAGAQNHLERMPTAACQPGRALPGSADVVVTEADAAAIRTIFDEDGELSAAIGLRRWFPGSATMRKRWHARGPSPDGRPPPAATAVTRLRPGQVLD